MDGEAMKQCFKSVLTEKRCAVSDLRSRLNREVRGTRAFLRIAISIGVGNTEANSIPLENLDLVAARRLGSHRAEWFSRAFYRYRSLSISQKWASWA